jgi:thioredoxin-dependent peroxiredoxin
MAKLTVKPGAKFLSRWTRRGRRCPGPWGARSHRGRLAVLYDRRMAAQLTPGDTAPNFTLADQNWNEVELSSFKGRKVLVYFYPKADTPGCTTQACGLRDVLGDIGDAVVLGISPDLPAKQAKFDAKYGLGFPLLSDADHTTAEAYGAWGEKSMYGKKYMGIVRSAFLVDENGALADVWYKISPKDTAARLLAAVSG